MPILRSRNTGRINNRMRNDLYRLSVPYPWRGPALYRGQLRLDASRQQ